MLGRVVFRTQSRKNILTLSVTNVTLTASSGSAEVHHRHRVLPCVVPARAMWALQNRGRSPQQILHDFLRTSGGSACSLEGSVPAPETHKHFGGATRDCNLALVVM